MKKKIVYTALFGWEGYPFHCLGETTKVVREPEDLKEVDSFLVVWGGADIDPAFYRHPLHSTTHPGGMRDRLEWSLMNEAKDKGIPIIGVCRGAQMLCALSKGFLIQDVRGHAGPHHMVTTFDDKKFAVNSLHHQMMCMNSIPAEEYQLIAWREGRNGAPYGYRDNKIFQPSDSWVEPEFVYFTKTKGYAIQWHPEMMSEESEATEYILDFINKQEEKNDAGYSYCVLPPCTC
jgi:gamma-glutamyl-gamma-aminobutyrate hydrolase PuuD